MPRDPKVVVDTSAKSAGKKAPANASTSAKETPAKKADAPKVPYVVIVRNAEVDLGIIHAEAISRFVMPRADKPDAVPQHSRYPSVSVREETLSALVRYDPRAYTASPAELAEQARKRVLFGHSIDYVAAGSLKDGNLQTRLVRATLSTSTNTNAQELRKVLADLPGFVSCRRVRSQVFHGVFTDRDSLFRSKMLLDEFEADGVRVTVALNSQHEIAYTEFARSHADAGTD